MEEKELQWQIIRTEMITPKVKAFWLSAIAEKPDFIAGQYLTIKLPGFEPSEGKAYSIASAPYETEVLLVIKEIGSFSKEIIKKEAGDTLITSEPYGFFYPEVDDEGELVFIVGGIGITPVLSIIKQLTEDEDKRTIHLHYSNQTMADAAFYNELVETIKGNPHFNLTSYITRETCTSPHLAKRFATDEVIKNVKNIENATFFLCGSMHFTKETWQNLRAEDIPAEQIYTEGFF